MNTTTVQTARTLRTTRLAAATVAVVAVSILAGDAASAGSDEPPHDLVLAQPVQETLLAEPVQDTLLAQPVPTPTLVQVPDPTLIPLPTVPPATDPPLELACEPWDQAKTSIVHANPVAGTVTVSIGYSQLTPPPPCDRLFVVHSIQLDDTLSPIGLLAEEHVELTDIVLDGGIAIVTVPIDPCFARVYTNSGPVVLNDTYYTDGCPPETTEPQPDPTEPAPDPTEPAPTAPAPTTPTVEVDPQTPQTPPAPFEGELPATGSSTVVTLGLIGALFLAVGAGLACGTRASQVRRQR